ncbi:scavenger receptor cysteine-rich type 1 protein M160-like isoform X1 [Montipora capricornis]|uniref:scavenger receptor cysteine-rich type 1 protein M160-like isoform X1 n=1 Tax=Montipora capricornis TaxID=246305 RepID=UPI0035F21109
MRILGSVLSINCVGFLVLSTLVCIEIKASRRGVCQIGLFRKNLYCVPKCGPGLYGNSISGNCDKCDPTCKTCLDGEFPTNCSSCNPPLHLQGTSCVKSCGDQRSKGPPLRQIKLVGGDGQFEGRVEIYRDNKWGTICDDSWDINDARVVCRELLLGDALEAVLLGRLGSGRDEQPVWLSNVNCTGNETRLENCAHPAWGQHSCGHFEDAGVRCAGPDTSRECVDKCGDGYFEVKGENKCGVCMASCLTCSSAENCSSCDKPSFLKGTACKTYCGDGFYGDPSDRKCKPCKPECRTCADGTSPRVCTSCHDDRYLLRAECVTSCAPLFVAQKRRLRLAGRRPTDLEGRLEVYRDGTWITVCDQTFDFHEASVVCRELGLGYAIKAVKKAGYGRGFGRVWTDVLNCNGRENSIFDCPLEKRGFTSLCYHGNDVGVQCAGPITKHLSNRCMKTCSPGWFKNDVTDICVPCAVQCLECLGKNTRCTKCATPKFLRENKCVDKCMPDEYGHIPKRECRKCDTSICVSCGDGSDRQNCTSCKEPKALKNGKCEVSCGESLFKKEGRCVNDCGVSMYKNVANYSCLPCPSDCITCEYNKETKQPVCTVCRPSKIFNGITQTCVEKCSPGQVAVPSLNFSKSANSMIRLVNGSDYLEGLLQVYHNGIWGTVCDDGWDSSETGVVCRQLRLGSGAFGVSLTHIPKGTGKLWLDDVFCVGIEDSLLKCRHRPWGQSNCQHNEDVVLRCAGPGVRTCQTSCPVGFFPKEDVCLQCSAPCRTCNGTADSCVECSSGFLKKNTSCVKDCGTGYFLDSVCKQCDPGCADCVGNATNCTSCWKPFYREGSKCVKNCTSGFKPSSLPLVRLVGGGNSLEGRVEVLHDGKYGTVCDDSWDIADANVVCRTLNKGNAIEATIRARFGAGTGNIWMDEVKCVGNETSLIACPHMGWGRENCDHSEDAGVICQGPDHSRDCLAECGIGYFLNKTDKTCGRCSHNCEKCEGTPENCSHCESGKFLNKTGNMSNCVVYCRKGFFGHPTTKVCQKCSSSCADCYNTSNNCTECPPKMYLLNFSCVANCSKRANKIVSGVPGLRLAGDVGTNSSFRGRVELFHKGEWGTVCDDNFDISEGTVICRQLKMGKALAVYSSAKFGQGTGRIWMDDTQCTGMERRLQDCKMNVGGFGANNCGHSEDAGVKCEGPDRSQRCVETCGEGFYEDGGNCKRCSEKCQSCLSKANECSRCVAPYFLQFTDCVTKCPIGWYGNTKSRTCKRCNKQCQTCYYGEKGNLCKSCPEGSYLKGLKCVPDCGGMSPVSTLFPPKPKKPLVRLKGGKSKQEGRVEVFYDGQWGTVCDDNWTLKEAAIVCSELGFGKPIEAPKHSYFGKGEGIVWMDNVNCFGYETSLTQCRQVGWGQGNCDPYHGEDAGVKCGNTTIEEISNNYCRNVNEDSCSNSEVCDTVHKVTCVDLLFFPESKIGSVCLQCPPGTAGDGKECRAVASKPPEFDQMPPARKIVKAQEIIGLRCRSKPPLIIPTVFDWRKDGKALPAEDVKSGRIRTDSGGLLIKSAQRGDSGIYTCILVNSEGNVTSNGSQVIVTEAPRILGVSSADVNLNANANLSCTASSFPSSNITWMFKGKKLQPSLKHEFLDSVATLTVKKVVFDDAGQYECTHVNEQGEARANASLTVGLTVNYVVFPLTTVADKSDDVTLKCNVTGVPKPRLFWKKEGELLTKTNKYTVTTDNSSETFISSQLIIRKVSRDDVARYWCISWNRGSVMAAPGRVLITGSPIILTPPKDLSVLSQANVSFYCEGLGWPNPKLMWLKDSVVIKPSKKVVIDENKGELKLFMVSIVDAAKYTCVYKNEHGEQKESAVLVVDGVDPRQSTRETQAPPQASQTSISTGSIIAIVVILCVIMIVIVSIVLYKYCHSRNQPFQFTVEGDTLRPSLRSRVKNAIGKNQSTNMYYNHSHEEINFDDSKPFVDHEEL